MITVRLENTPHIFSPALMVLDSSLQDRGQSIWSGIGHSAESIDGWSDKQQVGNDGRDRVSGETKEQSFTDSVSYTHLTLPTKA